MLIIDMVIEISLYSNIIHIMQHKHIYMEVLGHLDKILHMKINMSNGIISMLVTQKLPNKLISIYHS